MSSRYIVTVECDNLYAEIWINNLPIGTIAPHENNPFSFPVNEYIVEGANRIGIMLHAGPTPSSSAKPWGSDPKAQGYKGPSKMSLKFAKYAQEELPFREYPPVLVSIDWQGQAAPIPSYEEKQVSIPKTFDPPPWVSARTFPTLDAALRTSALEYLHSIYNFLSEHRFQAYIQAATLRLESGTKAYGMPAEPMKKELLNMLEEASKPPFHLDPFNPATIDFRLVADGRLLDVNRIDREPIFQYKQAGSGVDTFFFPIKIGQKEGKWMILA